VRRSKWFAYFVPQSLVAPGGLPVETQAVMIRIGSNHSLASAVAGLAAVLTGFVLAGCEHTPKIPPPPITLVSAPQASGIEVKQEGARTVIEIHSQRGIGSAWFTVAKKPPVQEACVRLHTRGLESFCLSQGSMDTTVSLSSQPPYAVRQTCQPAGQLETALEPQDPHWIKVQIVPSGDATASIPLKEGWFELALPATALAPGSGFRLNWVDFFR
jgi:hypothetical protein